MEEKKEDGKEAKDEGQKEGQETTSTIPTDE